MKELEQFYKDNYNMLVKRISFRAGSVENAEDIVQEAFTRAIKYWPSFDPAHRELGIWFNTILNNALRHFKRDERLYGMCEEFDEEEIDGQPMSQTAQGLQKFIEHEIKLRPDNIGEVLRLHFLFGYKPREISEVLDDCETAMISRVIYNFKEELRTKINV